MNRVLGALGVSCVGVIAIAGFASAASSEGQPAVREPDLSPVLQVVVPDGGGEACDGSGLCVRVEGSLPDVHFRLFWRGQGVAHFSTLCAGSLGTNATAFVERELSDEHLLVGITPVSTPRLTLESAVGSQFIVSSTAGSVQVFAFRSGHQMAALLASELDKLPASAEGSSCGAPNGGK